MKVIAALALCIVPQSPLLDDDVECLELNHSYDDQCNILVHQIIGWHYNPAEHRAEIVFWRLVKKMKIGRNQVVFVEGGLENCGAIRRVRYKSFFETWTQYDPEMNDRDVLPQNQRRGLVRFRKEN